MAEGLSATQRGKIAELHVATALMSQSGGRLSPFGPMSDDHGVDLIVLDKVTGRALPIQVKSWFLSPDRPVRTVQFDLQKSTFPKTGTGVVVCVLMDPFTLTMKMGWVIPIKDVEQLATDRGTKYVFAPSRMEGTKDKYARHRHADLTSLAAEIGRLVVHVG